MNRGSLEFAYSMIWEEKLKFNPLRTLIISVVVAVFCHLGSATADSWRDLDLTANSGAKTTGVQFAKPYVRADKVSSIPYEGLDSHIHELASVPGLRTWKDSDLTDVSHATISTFGRAMGYVRSDNVSAVVYGGDQYHIYQLALVGGTTWQNFDLTELSKG
jgi:hypothetical protein